MVVEPKNNPSLISTRKIFPPDRLDEFRLNVSYVAGVTSSHPVVPSRILGILGRPITKQLNRYLGGEFESRSFHFAIGNAPMKSLPASSNCRTLPALGDRFPTKFHTTLSSRPFFFLHLFDSRPR